MKMYTFFSIFFLTLCLNSDTGRAKQQRPISFSAEVVRSDSKQQGPSSKGMIYVGRGGIRTETNQDQKTIWMIFKPEKKIVWTLFPKQKMYMERSGLSLEWPPLPDDENSPCRSEKFQCQKNGWQTIDNRSVMHWKIAILGAKGKSSYAQLWVDPRLNVAIREHYADGLIVEMRHIRETPPEDSLFDLPKGYRKVTLPTVPANNPQDSETSH